MSGVAHELKGGNVELGDFIVPTPRGARAFERLLVSHEPHSCVRKQRVSYPSAVVCICLAAPYLSGDGRPRKITS